MVTMIKPEKKNRVLIRPAATLRAERKARQTASEENDLQKYLKQAVDCIELAHANGKSEVHSLTYPDSVVKALRAKGYTVKYYRAGHMGDMDSHVISWDKEDSDD